MGHVEVRRAEANDATTLANLRWRFRREESADEPSWGRAEFVTECAKWIQSRIGGGTWMAWVAEVDGEAVGHVFLCRVEKVPSPYGGAEELGYLTNVYVGFEWRQRGLGRLLLDTAVRYAREKGMDTIIVWPSERSTPLYRRVGFDPPRELLELPISLA